MMNRARHDLIVIPGRREAANPESILRSRGYGFRVRAFGASRNDSIRECR
jgi:hypothetical protein